MMNFTQKSAFSLVGKFLSSVLGLVSSLLLARYLGVKGVGQYQTFISAQVVLIAFLTMGFGQSAVYFINKLGYKRKKIINLLTSTFILVSVTAIFIAIIIFVLGDNYFGTLKFFAILLFCIGLGSLLLYTVLLPVFYVNIEVKKIQLMNLLSSLTLILGLLISNYYHLVNVEIALSLVGLSNIMSFFLLLYFLRNDLSYKLYFDKILLVRLLKYGLKLSIANLFLLIGINMVIFLLKKIAVDGFTEVGLLSRAMAIANILLIIPSTIAPLIYSKWSKLGETSIHIEVEKTIRILTTISFLFVITVFLFSKEIVVLLYGIDFIEASSSLKILSWSILLTNINIVLISMFASIGKPEVSIKSYFGSLLVTILFSLLFIPHFNNVGAAIALLTGYLYNTIALLYYSRINNMKIMIRNMLFMKRKDLNILNSIIKKNNLE